MCAQDSLMTSGWLIFHEKKKINEELERDEFDTKYISIGFIYLFIYLSLVIFSFSSICLFVGREAKRDNINKNTIFNLSKGLSGKQKGIIFKVLETKVFFCFVRFLIK